MTIICYKDGVMAADTRIISGDGILTNVKKVHKIRHGLLGLCGSLGNCYQFLDLMSNVTDPFTKGFDRDNFFSDDHALLVKYAADHRHHIYLWETFRWVSIQEPDFSIGCAWQIGRAAMLAGASAEEAVGLACQLDHNCGGLIDAVRL